MDVVRKGSGARNAAKGAQFKLRMRSGVVMQMVRHARHGGRTQLQREWNPIGRHETGGNIGTKQKQGQQQDAGP
jgi:hypothetical protein